MTRLPDLHVLYWARDVDVRFGKSKGAILSISSTPPTGRNEVCPQIGRTIIPHDVKLVESLLSGEATIDTDRSTGTHGEITDRKNPLRQTASDVVRLSPQSWVTHSAYQAPATERLYESYARSFLRCFTSVTSHIPPERQLEVYPHALVVPCQVRVLVGRDGVAFVYDAPRRPETVTVRIDSDRILNELILPHPTGKSYSFPAPLSTPCAICDDSHYQSIRGHGHRHESSWGNPHSVIVERSFHQFIHSLEFVRKYPDGTETSSHVQFAEVFGSTSPADFTPESAERRARLYATQWSVQAITGTQVSSVDHLQRIVSDFRALVERYGISESEIEDFIDAHPWVVERALGYRKFRSQVVVPADLLSRSSHGIKPDKILERHDGFSDVLDLKRADVPLLVRKLNRSHASARLTEAEAQVESYVRFVEEPDVREHLHRIGISVLRPRGLLLIGRRPQASREDWEDVRRRLSVLVRTYDDVLDELDAIVAWIRAIA